MSRTPLYRSAFALRFITIAAIVAVILSSTVAGFAQLITGQINGTITAAGKPVPNAQISAASPSGKYSATTDARGFFAIAGVQPETYTVTITATGFEPYTISGVTVFQNQTTPVVQAINQRLQQIGRTTARSTASAFQPSVPVNTYNLGAAQIKTQLGKNNAISETSLLVSLPGATLDSSGYPVLRGGRENEEGFQFEGIDYTDAFTSQFVNSLGLNNPTGFQLIPGSGDASSGNTGTGIINLLAKRGTFPAFGSIDLEALTQPFTHQAAFEYGFASPNNAISNYVTFTGYDQQRQYGAFGRDANSIGAYFNTSYNNSRDLIDNLVFRFGKGQNQSLQVVYQNQDSEFRANYGGLQGLNYKTADPYSLSRYRALTGLTNAQIQSVFPLYPLGQTSGVQPLNLYSGSIQPNDTMKFQYSISPSASSYFTIKAYQVNSVGLFDRPFISADSNGNYYAVAQGGTRHGVAFDGQIQLNESNLLKFGAKYEFLHPVSSAQYGNFGAEGIGPVFSNGNELPDFLPGGYLARNGFTNLRTPYFIGYATTNRQDSSLYVTDSITAGSRLKADIGVRLDGANYQLPNPATNPDLYLTGSASLQAGIRNAIVPEPKVAVSYQLGRNDAVRGSFARTVEFAPIADIDNQANRGYYQGLPYANLASTADVCGINFNLKCRNYGDQLFWDLQNSINGIPITPVKPETFTNYDFSYSHQFGGNVAVRVTPFYRRGYDALVLEATVRRDPTTGAPVTDPVSGAFQFNPSVATNLGTNRTTGIEFYLTKDNPGPGFSGSVSATYLNEFSNVIPLTASEDFFPTIPSQSAILGNQYRVGFLSPFQATAAISYKTRSGFRINPIVTYNIGYPINYGSLTSAFVGAQPFNVVNTNVTSSFGASVAPAFVDTQNPGSLFNPNIAATRGTKETAAAGGILSAQRVTANVAIEFSPRNAKGSTFGVYVANLFNQVYGQPAINARYQPVATGVSGINSGKTSATYLYPGDGFANYTTDRFGNMPYTITPNSAPRTFRLYYQLAL